MNMIKLATAVLVTLVLGACVATESVNRNTSPTEEAPARLFDLGVQYYRNGNYELARDRLQRSLELDRRNASAHSLLALTFVQLGNRRLATESFDRSIRLAPNDKDIRNAYAVFLCDQGRYDEAVEHFDRAIAIRENDTSWIEMSNAGVCIANKPDYERAEQYFRDALQLRPNYGEALIQLAALEFRTEDCLSARAFVERYLDAFDASPPVLLLAIQVENCMQDERASTDYQNQLLRDFPDSAESQAIRQQSR